MPDEPLSAITLRVQRLEESHGFAEHTIEQLSTQLLTLSRQLETASRRIASLEERLGKLRVSNAGDTSTDLGGGDAPTPGLNIDS
ncbi:MAG: SlyX family protein [Planctomycetota bacterium]